MAIAEQFNRWEQQTLALAGVAQSALLVRELAYLGDAPAEELAATINPLLVLNPPSFADIYTDVQNMTRGLKCLESLFSNERTPEHGEVLRYTIGMLTLRSKLIGDPQMPDTLRRRLQYIDPLSAAAGIASDHDLEELDFSPSDRSYQQLAKLYQDTISTLSHRIQVQGKVDFLKDERVANRIRALLLAGIRSAVLWYQLGGRRWRLLVYRRRVQQTAASLARHIALNSDGTDVRSKP